MTELSKTKLSVAELEVPKREPLKVVIDDGSKAAKLVCINQNGDLVPNLSLNSFVAEFRVSHEGSKPFNYLVDGLQRYSHHSEASDALETTDVSHQYDEISRLNVHHASVITPQEVHVYVTLPLSQFYTSLGETNDENIQRKKDNLLKPIERFVDGKRQSFNIVAVTVFPESLSAVTRADGLEKIDSFESSLVIDLGGTTLDIASITGQLEQISKVKGFDRIGCSVIYDEIRRYLKSEKLISSNAYIQHLIGNRENKFALKVADDKRDNLFAAVQEALNKLQVMVVKATSQVEETPHNVFLVGGGSYFISEAISQHFVNSNIIVIDEPQFALSLAIADSVFA